MRMLLQRLVLFLLASTCTAITRSGNECWISRLPRRKVFLSPRIRPSSLPLSCCESKHLNRLHRVDNNAAAHRQPQPPEPGAVPFRVSYRGRSLDIDALPGESVLSALERHQAGARLGLLTELPSECRRGNCFTCAAKTAAAAGKAGGDDFGFNQRASPSGGDGDRLSSESTASLRIDDGLAPSLSRWIAGRGLVLTCSTYVCGPGVHLNLCGDDDDHVVGLRREAWQCLCAERLGGDDARKAAREAAAKVLRRSAERNIDDWRRETEKVLLMSPPEGIEDELTLS